MHWCYSFGQGQFYTALGNRTSHQYFPDRENVNKQANKYENI